MKLGHMLFQEDVHFLVMCSHACMGGPICIYGYLGEYLIFLTNFLYYTDRAINLASVCIEINPRIGQAADSSVG
jgi:hypothetical protein